MNTILKQGGSMNMDPNKSNDKLHEHVKTNKYCKLFYKKEWEHRNESNIAESPMKNLILMKQKIQIKV